MTQQPQRWLGPGAAALEDAAARSKRRRLRNVGLWVGLVIVLGITALSLLAPILPLPEPTSIYPAARLQPPSLEHWFGTDNLGRDMLSRVIYGAQIDLLLGVVTTYVSLAIGIVFGVIAGFYRGIRESVTMRLVDTLIAFPFLVLVLAIVGMVGPGLLGVYIGIIVVSWTIYARITYSEMLVLRERQYILAARTLGYSDWRILIRHAIPNLLRPNLVFSLVDVVLNVLALASLSYLGLGVKPPTPELGSLIAGGQPYLLTGWWITTLPGLVVVAIGVGFSLVGEAVADRLSVAQATTA
jgi:peptide/nickel transport system permease protein